MLSMNPISSGNLSSSLKKCFYKESLWEDKTWCSFLTHFCLEHQHGNFTGAK